MEHYIVKEAAAWGKQKEKENAHRGTSDCVVRQQALALRPTPRPVSQFLP